MHVRPGQGRASPCFVRAVSLPWALEFYFLSVLVGCLLPVPFLRAPPSGALPYIRICPATTMQSVDALSKELLCSVSWELSRRVGCRKGERCWPCPNSRENEKAMRSL